MVNAGTYPLWQQIAVTEGLPDEALPAVIEALCTASRAFYGVDNSGDESRKQAFAAALSTLLQRAAKPALHRRLLAQADDKQLADLADQGVVTAADLPAILRTHRLPEMVGLPKPSVTCRHRLNRIAERVRYNPGLMDIVAEQLHAVADECVRRGRLLTPPRNPKDDRYKAITVAEDLARLSANPGRAHRTGPAPHRAPHGEPLRRRQVSLAGRVSQQRRRSASGRPAVRVPDAPWEAGRTPGPPRPARHCRLLR
ncbi:hypothetical protein ACIOC2_35745 [Streptomyces sp. NPDC088337]|uniref:hypothetical protein n=1 Tax=unclassified Streptomyces TaxID=2593676 RepID=UPI002DDAE04E|nr:hypothetical protein [Streptomyces sp. NBC_01788]WSB25574.1 hypothetical protein OIE49_06625 [Streptomyces sp. NBC_01788]